MSSFGEILSTAKESIDESHVLDRGNLSSSILHGTDKKLKSIGASIYNAGATVLNASYSDGIEVPVSTTTLIGEDFRDLYVSCTTKNVNSVSGVPVTVLRSGSEYDTEMHGSFCKSFSDMDYNLLNTDQKAVYELSLLSKKYAYELDHAEEGAVDDLQTNYLNKVANYRSVCEESGYSWDEIVYQVSAELQSDTAYDISESSKIISSSDAGLDNDRVISNVAHKSIVACGTENYVDKPAASIFSHGLTYEDTLNTDVKYDNTKSSKVYNFNEFFAKMVTAFKNLWDKYSLHPGKVLAATKDAISDGLDDLTALDKASEERYNREYGDGAQSDEVSSEESVDNTSSISASDIVEAGKYNVKTIADAVATEAKNLKENQSSDQSVNDSAKGITDYAKDGIDYLKNGGAYGVEKTKEFLSKKYGNMADSELGLSGDNSANVDSKEYNP